MDKQVADALKTIDTKNLSKAEVADALSHAFGYTVKLTQNGVDVISNSDKFSENDVITATWNGKSGTATVTIHDAVDTVLQNAVDAIESKMLPENNSDISKDYPEITSQTTTTDLKNYAEAVLSDAGITGVAVKYVVKDGDKDIANGANLSGHFTLSYTKDNKEYTADAKYNLPTATEIDINKLIAYVQEQVQYYFDKVNDNNEATGEFDEDAAKEYIQSYIDHYLTDNKRIVGEFKVEGVLGTAPTHTKDGKLVIKLSAKKGRYSAGDLIEEITVKHSDGQKIKDIDDAVRKAAAAADTTDIQNKNDVDTVSEDEVQSFAEKIVTKALASAIDGSVVSKDYSKLSGESVKAEVTKYTPSTSKTEGTAHVVVTTTLNRDYPENYQYIDGGRDAWNTEKTISSTVEFDLTFAKLKAVKTAYIYLGNTRYETYNPTADINKITVKGSDYLVSRNGNDPLKYSSSNENVIVVDPDTGDYTVKGIGETTITVQNADDTSVTSSVKIIVKQAEDYPFTDVQDTKQYFFNAVYGLNDMTGHTVVNGTTDTTFSPAADVTRAQFVTFLYRAAGEPIVKQTSLNKFADVSSDAYYAKVIAWAVDNGITYGTDDTHFTPNATVTRAQAATFLYRAYGKSSDRLGNADSNFTDINGSDYYATAVRWGVANNIIFGTTATTFSPSDNCNRGQAVTLIYRAFGWRSEQDAE
ncbi:MAG: S-layer homology domain-containing protein [Eubacterium sp.]|nr:S-layer homology domain-containing protein [Eubacterium sp.]